MRIFKLSGKENKFIPMGNMSDMEKSIVEYLSKNPNPKDEGKGGFHEWAESKGYNKHKAEESVYKLMTLFTEFATKGRANEDSFTEDDADPKELKMGMGIEMEHTTNKEIAKRISLDHLSEIKDYYTRLKKMEEEAGIDD